MGLMLCGITTKVDHEAHHRTDVREELTSGVVLLFGDPQEEPDHNDDEDE